MYSVQLSVRTPLFYELRYRHQQQFYPSQFATCYFPHKIQHFYIFYHAALSFSMSQYPKFIRFVINFLGLLQTSQPVQNPFERFGGNSSPDRIPNLWCLFQIFNFGEGIPLTCALDSEAVRSKISPVVPQAQGETCFAEKGRRCRTSRSGGSIFTAGNCKCLHRPEQPRLKAQRVHFILSKKADSGDIQTAPQHCRLFAVRDLAFSKTR